MAHFGLNHPSSDDKDDLVGFDIYGHSWGGTLAFEYAVQHDRCQIRGVHSIIAHGAPGDIPLMHKVAAQLITTLPQQMQDAIHRHEADGSHDSPEYREAVAEFYERFVGVKGFEKVQESMAELGADMTVYKTM